MAVTTKHDAVAFSKQKRRSGFSLGELLAVVAILGILAGIVFPRIIGSDDSAKQNACYMNKGHLEVQAQLWFRSKGTWPTVKQLCDDPAYCPDGDMTCPLDGAKYEFEDATHLIRGHAH